MSPAAESFLDELVTWREIGFNMLARRPEAAHDFDTLPPGPSGPWRSTPAIARDPLYDRSVLERAETHDPVWNAAQRELLRARTHPQLPADALGEEDPAVDAPRRGRRSRRCST